MGSDNQAMELFRAVPRHRVSATDMWTGRQNTKRIPGNVPYVVDNVWEFLRPEHMPSRRHAVYASPTPELALENATADDNKSGYVVFRVVIRGNFKIAQLQLKDAREHPDIRAITRLLQKHSADFTECSLETKRLVAPLFLPGISAQELKNCRSDSTLMGELFAAFQKASIFWSDATSNPVDQEGELFFELFDNAAYALKPLIATGNF